MKKIFFLLIITSIFIVSCSDFLDVTPNTSWSGLNFPTEETHLDGLLYGGYERLQSVLSTGFVIYGEMRADAFKVNAFSVNNDKIVNNKLDHGMRLSSWAGFYEVVKQANTVLEFTPILLEKNKLTEEKADLLMGQAYSMRALAYFYIIRIWGDAPLVTKPFLTKNDLDDLTRTSVDSVLSCIHNDLQESATLLPSSRTNRTEFSRTAAYAIDAHAYAWEKKYDKVIELSDKILNNNSYSLETLFNADKNPEDLDFVSYVHSTPYVDIFNKGLSKESIFELAFSVDDGDDSRYLSSYFSAAWPLLRPFENFASSFDETDWRAVVANKLNPSGSYTAIKFTIGFNSVEDSRNIVLFRLADIYLLKAEALINLNDTDENRKAAMKLVNDIRRRAGGETFEIPEEVYLDRNIYKQEDIKNLILEERKFELCYEGHRWFDLVRTEKVIDVLRDTKGIELDPKSIVWPINIEEIRRSKNIEQNDYYK